jgi:hypothetical protein
MSSLLLLIGLLPHHSIDRYLTVQASVYLLKTERRRLLAQQIGEEIRPLTWDVEAR